MIIELTEDEALVLFEMLARSEGDSDERQLRLEHVAERNALWALHAQLERVLTAPFQRDYDDLLAGARMRVEAAGGSW
jgi:hypothetical protein